MIKKNIYLENIQKCARNQIKWQNLETEEEIESFLRQVTKLIESMYAKSYDKWLKSQKTRHG